MKSRRPTKSRYGSLAVVLVFVLGPVLGFILGYLLKPVDERIVTELAFEEALVARVIDGDTVELADGRRVRYLGIDTPEHNEYFFEEATNRNRELVEGKTVELQAGEKTLTSTGGSSDMSMWTARS